MMFRNLLKTQLLIILPLIILLSSNMALAKNWTLGQFISQFYKANENLQVAEGELSISQLQYDGIDYWKSLLTLGGERNAFEYQQPSGSKTQSNYLSANYTQTIPKGLSLTAGLKSTLSQDKNTTGSGANIENLYSLSLSKSLRNNLWGEKEAEEKKLYKAAIRAQQSLLVKQKVQTCESAINTYMQTYISQENKKILAEIMDYSQRALKVLQSGYNKKLISPAKYYSSKVSLLSIKQRQLKANADYNLKIVSFNHSINQDSSKSAGVLQPVASPEKLSAVEFSLEQVIDYKVAQQQAKKAQSNVELQKASNADDWGLSLKYDQKKGDIYSGGNFVDYKDNATVVSLTIPLDILNKGEQSQLKSKLERLNITNLQLHKVKKTAYETYIQLKQNQDIVDESIQLNKEKTMLSKKQVLYTLKKLNSGQMDIDDLVIYQDQYYVETLNSWKLVQQSLVNQVQLLGYFGQLHSVCGGQQ